MGENSCDICDNGEAEFETDYGFICAECKDNATEEMGLT